jgi:hypothetical protein
MVRSASNILSYMVPTRPRKDASKGFERPCQQCKQYTRQRDHVQHAAECEGTGESIGPGKRPARERGYMSRPKKRGIGGLYLERSLCSSVSTRSRTVANPRSWETQSVHTHSKAHFAREAEAETRRLLTSLKQGHRGSVGIPVKKASARPDSSAAQSAAQQLQLQQRNDELANMSIAVPSGMNLSQYKRVVKAVCSSPNICTLFIGGARALTSSTTLPPGLEFLIRHVATSHLVNLNVGEYEGCNLEPLLEALQHPQCIVGHLFAELTTKENMPLKKSMKLALKVCRRPPPTPPHSSTTHAPCARSHN